MPSKVVKIPWRVCRGCLPTMHALQMKHVNLSAQCPWYYNEVKYDTHVLFTCDFARTVWFSFGIQQLVQVWPNDTAAMVIMRSFEGCNREQSAFGVKASAVNLLHDEHEAQVIEGGGNQNVVTGERVWFKPPLGWVKVNVDATIFQNGFIGVGCVLRDTHGQFLGARCKRVEGAWRPREAEAIGLKEAMSWVKRMNITHCVFETDSKSVANACNDTSGEAYFGTIVSNCISIMKHIDHVLVKFAYRSANMIGHVLAKATYSMPDIGE
ncbi:uncharacterized protein LOC141719551 [Apium graveolens]|uniref:uncharacterized protein LOC141719551 n=1 Tax=Apium graveolens TaxID=4045 RepID=UPI003D7B41B6